MSVSSITVSSSHQPWRNFSLWGCHSLRISVPSRSKWHCWLAQELCRCIVSCYAEPRRCQRPIDKILSSKRQGKSTERINTWQTSRKLISCCVLPIQTSTLCWSKQSTSENLWENKIMKKYDPTSGHAASMTEVSLGVCCTGSKKMPPECKG